MARGDAGGAGGGDAGGDADAVAPSGPPPSTGRGTRSWAARAVSRQRGVLSTLYVRTIPGIIRAIVHWQEVGYGGVLHNSCFIDDH